MQRLLAAVLRLGDVSLHASGDHSFTVCERDGRLDAAAQLLAVAPSALADALTTRSISPDADPDSDYGRTVMPLYPHEALTTRNALAQHIFALLVGEVTRRANVGARPVETASVSIGVLDTSGFDKAQPAGLHELLSNYAAEKVHAQLHELVHSPPLPTVDAALEAWAEPQPKRGWTAVALLEQAPVGLLHAVDRQSKTADATDESLCALLAAAHTGKPCLQIDNWKALTIHHFDGTEPVSYEVQGFLERNRCEAAASHECRQLLHGSESALLRALAASEPPAESASAADGTRARLRPSACRDVLRAVAEAFALVGAADCAVVACLRPVDDPESAAPTLVSTPRRRLDD
eukprot:3572356-Prymnesium_polylepis.1